MNEFKPKIVSVKDRNGDDLLLVRMARYDSHRVAAPMATHLPPKPREQMATWEPGPPSRYDVEDYDALAPARGIVVSAIIVAFILFVVTLVFAS